jgi:hypothetical protein
MNTLSGLRHRTLPQSMDLVGATIGPFAVTITLLLGSWSAPSPFDSFPIGITARARPTSTHAFGLRELPHGASRSIDCAAQRQMHVLNRCLRVVMTPL